MRANGVPKREKKSEGVANGQHPNFSFPKVACAKYIMKSRLGRQLLGTSGDWEFFFG